MPEAAAARGSSDAPGRRLLRRRQRRRPQGAGWGGTALPFSPRSLDERHVTSAACALPAASPGSRRPRARARVPLPLRSGLPAPPPAPAFQAPAVHVAVTPEAAVEIGEVSWGRRLEGEEARRRRWRGACWSLVIPLSDNGYLLVRPSPAVGPLVAVGHRRRSVVLPLAPLRAGGGFPPGQCYPIRGSGRDTQDFLSPGLTASEAVVADQPCPQPALCVRGGRVLGRRGREKQCKT